jgi:hypothetical protein
MQIDACRVACVNENLANARRWRAGLPARRRVGLCELSAPGDVRLRRGDRDGDGRMIEWIDHLHNHFPASRRGHRKPQAHGTGASTELRRVGGRVLLSQRTSLAGGDGHLRAP